MPPLPRVAMIKSSNPTPLRKGLRDSNPSPTNPAVKKAEASKVVVTATTAKSISSTLRGKIAVPAAKPQIGRPSITAAAKKKPEEGQAEAMILFDSVDTLDHLGIDPFTPELRVPTICAEKVDGFSSIPADQPLGSSAQETLSHQESTVACEILMSPSNDHSQQGASHQAKSGTTRGEPPQKAHEKGEPV